MREHHSRRPLIVYFLSVVFCLGAAAQQTRAQQAPVTLQVEIVKRKPATHPASKNDTTDASNVVVWLVPADGTRPTATHPGPPPQLVQRDKGFEPHVLVIETGSMVQFPNKDPFFHNVFSLYDGKRFDLGLYEAGSSRSVRFDRPGVSFLFCNIHPEMSAVVVAVESPYFALSDRSGRVSIVGVPDGRYHLHVWYERSSQEDLKSLDRVVTISGSARSLELIQVMDNGDYQLTHKNKYGQDYMPATGPAYKRP